MYILFILTFYRRFSYFWKTTAMRLFLEKNQKRSISSKTLVDNFYWKSVNKKRKIAYNLVTFRKWLIQFRSTNLAHYITDIFMNGINPFIFTFTFFSLAEKWYERCCLMCSYDFTHGSGEIWHYRFHTQHSAPSITACAVIFLF